MWTGDTFALQSGPNSHYVLFADSSRLQHVALSPWRSINITQRRHLALVAKHPTWTADPTHHVIVVVGTPEVRTATGAEVGFVTFGLVDPFPVEVPPEVDVERAQAAALVWATETQHTHRNIQTPILLVHRLGQEPKAGSWENDNGSPLKTQPSQGNDRARLPEFSPAAWGSLNKTLHACWPAV